MKGFNRRRKRSGDLRVKIYVSSDLVARIDNSLVSGPVGKERTRAFGYAIQELVDTLIWANEHGQKVNVTETLVESVFLCQLGAEPKSRADKARKSKTGSSAKRS